MIKNKTKEFIEFIKDEYKSIFFWHKPKNIFKIKNIEVTKTKDKFFNIKFKDKPLFFFIANSKIVRLIIENLLIVEKIEEESNLIKEKLEKFGYNMSNEEKNIKRKKLETLEQNLENIKKYMEKLLDMDQDHQSNIYELELLKKQKDNMCEDNPKFWILESKILVLEEKIEKRERYLDSEIEKFNIDLR